MRDKWVLWPIYFDLRTSRRRRKLSKNLAVNEPNIEEIYKAAKKLGLNPIKEEKAYPSRWWRKEGRILVEKKEKKVEIIRKIAEIIKQNRSSSEKTH